MKRGGFTLIELLVVIAIIAILAGAMVPMFSGVRQEAKEAKATAELDSIKTACIMYHHDYSDWPNVGAEEQALVTGSGFTGYKGPYLDAWKDDPWENAYSLFDSGTQLWAESEGADAQMVEPALMLTSKH